LAWIKSESTRKGGKKIAHYKETALHRKTRNGATKEGEQDLWHNELSVGLARIYRLNTPVFLPGCCILRAFLLYSYEAIGRNPERHTWTTIRNVLPESMIEQGSAK